MPFPPAPVLVRVTVPPLMATLASELMPAQAFVLLSSLSHVPLPEQLAVSSPPAMSTLPSALMPLAAAAVVVMLSVPPVRLTLPVSSASRSVSSLYDTCMPSSPMPESVAVPLSMAKYWLQLMASFAAFSTLSVRFFTVTYSLEYMPWRVFPYTLSVPFPFSSRWPLQAMQPFCSPSDPSVSVFSVSFLALSTMRLPS